jgi:hypothetical protein
MILSITSKASHISDIFTLFSTDLLVRFVFTKYIILYIYTSGILSPDISQSF